MKSADLKGGQAVIPTNRTALMAGLWYTFGTVVAKAMVFLSTPFFARIMPKEAMGSFTNLASWISIFATVTACDFHTSIIRSKYDFADDLDSYAFSILTLTHTIVLIFVLLLVVFRNFVFGHILFVDFKYAWIVFLYLLLFPAFNTYATLQRVRYRYRIFTILSFAYALSSVLLALLLLMVLRDKLEARVIGQYLPMLIIGLFLLVPLVRNGKRIRFQHWKYALRMCLPLLPHLISIYGMSTVGKAMVRQLSGVEATAVFGIAYTCAQILSLLVQSANQGWAPWMLDMLHIHREDKVRRAGRVYIAVLLAFVVVLMLLAPEIVSVLGGSAYAGSLTALPMLFLSGFLQMLYMMYLQTEFYEKKTFAIGINSSIAVACTFLACRVLIPRFGLSGAGYGVLLGYFVLFLLHYAKACRLGYGKLLDSKVVFGSLLAGTAAMLLSQRLYTISPLRYAITLSLLALGAGFALTHRRQIGEYARKLMGKGAARQPLALRKEEPDENTDATGRLRAAGGRHSHGPKTGTPSRPL